MEEIKKVIDKIKSANYVIALTGAGISVESGIPPFRGDSGLWKKYRPEIYATLPGIFITFVLFPRKVLKFVSEVTQTILNASPNKAHFALTEMENKGYLRSIITQNIDNLHQKAASKNVVELHGNILKWYCTRCNKTKIFSENELRNFIEQLKKQKGRINIIRMLRKSSRCECSGRVRPGIVFFGESLPIKEFMRAENELEKCDCFLLVGTSGMVSPAANLPHEAKRKGATLIEMNPEPTQLTPICDFSILEKADRILPEIVKFL